MNTRKYINFGIVFFVIISSAIAFNNIVLHSNSIIADLTVDFTFTNDNACSGQSVSFTSDVAGDGDFKYAWSFGDGVTSNLPNPTHRFEATGCDIQNYPVSLTVTDSNGIIKSKTRNVAVKPRPKISFIDTSPGTAGQFDNCGNKNPSSQFLINVGNVSVSSSCITSYSIRWGDGQTSADVKFPISHNYDGYGTYNMTITAIGSNGCSNSVTYPVRNATNPSGGISGPGNTQNLCAPSKDIDFEITNWGKNTSDTTYEVEYGDGARITYSQIEMVASAFYNAANPSSSLPFPIQPHSYTRSSCPGEFVAKLWIRNACTPNPNPATLPNILIIISPEARFTSPSEACVDMNIGFTNTSASGFGYNCNSNDRFT